MKSRVVLSVLGVTGILALSATVVHAGSGGSPFPLTSFFVCHGINGDDPGKVVNVDASVLLTNPRNVRLGNATVACVVAKLFDALTETEIPPPPLGVNSDGLKCYTVSVSRQPNTKPPTRWDITDSFGLETDVPASDLRYICAPATFTNPH